MRPLSSVAVVTCLLCVASGARAADKTKPDQYQFEKIHVPAASADEAVRKSLSVDAAVNYLENGAKAWSGARKCVSCHTNGSYLVIRPSLTKQLGPPSHDIRKFFVGQLSQMQKTDRKKLMTGIRPTQVAYVAAGLAEWDRYVTGKTSSETDAALRLMLSLQSKDGSQGNTDCWPPHESSSYHGATVAASAVAAAPGWLQSLKKDADKDVLAKIRRLQTYLRDTEPPHDYGRVLLLWSAGHMTDIADSKRKDDLIKTIWKHQRDDGGWSIRTFAAPEKWGRGNRAAKLRAEPEFKNPQSDGHMTGLAVLVLREAGVPASDPRIQKAVKWLRSNQRESGRWWTRSLNTDRYHFITYTGTLYPLAALAKCNALPKTATKSR